MSAIFDALKKMNAKKRPEKAKKPTSIRERRNVYTLGQIILSPFILLPVTVVVVGGIFLFYYSAQYFSDPTPFSVSQAAEETADQGQVVSGVVAQPDPEELPDDDLAPEEDAFPAPPDIVMDDRLEATVQNDIERDNLRHTGTMSEPLPLNPDAQAGSSTSRSFDGRDYAENYKIVARDSVFLPPGSQTDGTMDSHPAGSNQDVMNDQPGSQGAMTAGEPTDAMGYPRPPEYTGDISQKKNISDNLFTRNTASVQYGATIPSDMDPWHDEAHEPHENQNTSDETIDFQIVDTGNSNEIVRLVKAIEKDIETGQNGQALDKLVDKLSSAKGEDHFYVLKMKAFCLMNKGEYASAELILKKVLMRKKNDLEAGINMAVIESRTDRKDKARARLLALQKVYPDNTFLPEMTRKLK
ncbi:MAG: tetratricopeptide repeat protein [Proteobacteria bacterium]|nr:tetratricopeptide repeat protein [Pseudomonadota bacterium]